MGLTKEEFLGLKAGDKLKDADGEICTFLEFDSAGDGRLKHDEFRITRWIFKSNLLYWTLIEKTSPFPIDHPGVTSVFVSPGIQPENNLKLVLQ